ncbi:MAG: hypothetical protein V3W41_02475 [Planctomycetota bacterium]
MSGRRRSPIFASVVLLLAGACIAPFAAGGFLIDDWYILSKLAVGSNPLAPSLNPWRHFLVPFESRQDIYRPIIGVAYWWDWQLYGSNPVGYHITNLVFHLAGGALLFGLVRRLRPGDSPIIAAGAALYFLTFPGQVESIAWIAARTESMSWCFGAVALHMKLRSPREVWGSSVLLLLSVLCKESAVVFGWLLLVLTLWPDSRPGDLRERFTLRLRRAIGLAAAGITYLALRLIVFGGLGLRYAMRESLLDRMGPDPIMRIWDSAKNGLLPLPPDLVDPRSTLGLAIHLVWAAVLCAAVFGVVAAWRAREWRWVVMVLALLFLPFMIGVMANPINSDLRNSRALYTPVAAISLMLARALSVRKWPVTLSVVLAIVACLMLVTVVGYRYVESSRAVTRSAESLRSQVRLLPSEKTVAVLHGVRQEKYYGGVVALLVSLPYCLRPPFTERSFDVEFVLGPKDGVRGGPLADWRQFDVRSMAKRVFFVAHRGDEGTQSFRLLRPIVNEPLAPEPVLIQPKSRGRLVFRKTADGGREIEFRFSTSRRAEGLQWKLIVLDAKGVMIEHIIPEVNLHYRRSGDQAMWVARLPISAAALKEVSQGERLAWTVYGLRNGKPMTAAPEIVFFDADI